MDLEYLRTLDFPLLRGYGVTMACADASFYSALGLPSSVGQLSVQSAGLSPRMCERVTDTPVEVYTSCVITGSLLGHMGGRLGRSLRRSVACWDSTPTSGVSMLSGGAASLLFASGTGIRDLASMTSTPKFLNVWLRGAQDKFAE